MSRYWLKDSSKLQLTIIYYVLGRLDYLSNGGRTISSIVWVLTWRPGSWVGNDVHTALTALLYYETGQISTYLFVWKTFESDNVHCDITPLVATAIPNAISGHNQTMGFARPDNERIRTCPRDDRPATTWFKSDVVALSPSHGLWQPTKPRC
ncbi:hypothetical protein LY78DRAFT_287251 [Colletotrichum sublineola]|nr:hypothetical protein LY78DRAFT_287251 [Colletotrichum sublineola]